MQEEFVVLNLAGRSIAILSPPSSANSPGASLVIHPIIYLNAFGKLNVKNCMACTYVENF